jgi:hypothetical protein
LGGQVINLPSPNLLPPLRKQMKGGATCAPRCTPAR